MICIHPVVTHNFSTFSQLCARTGMRAIHGKRYWLLVPATKLEEFTSPASGKPFPPASTSTTGGDAA